MTSSAPLVIQTTASSPVAPAAQKADNEDLWGEAVKLLSPDDGEQIRLRKADKLTVLSEVLAAATEKRDRCKDRQWKFKKRDGTVIVLRDVFDKVITWLNKLQKVGDFVAQLDPVHLALPWSIIKFFLQLSTGDSEKLGTVYDGIEKITNLMGRYAIFEDLYLRESSKASTMLKNAIVKLYASVLTYLAGAKRYYMQSTAKRMAKNVLQISDLDIDKLEEDIQGEQISVDELARLIDAESLRNANESMNRLSSEVREHKKELRKALADLNIQIISDQISDLTKELESSKKRDLLRWISKIPYLEHHENVRKDRLEGSGIWLFDQPQYMQWKRSKSSSLLWLHGIPGSGKSRLVSLLIDTLRENPINPQAESLAYVYCARNATEPERGEPLTILRSILRQLSCPKPHLGVHDVVLKKYQQLQQEGFDPRDLSLAETKGLILELLEHDRATIIIDALDECVPDRRYQLLASIEELVEKASCPVKIIVSSRDYEDIASRLSKLSNFKIDAGNNKGDIERFVRLEVTRSVQESRLLGGRASIPLQEKVIRTLIEGAQGMFLWVALQLQNLCNPQRMKFEKDIIQELGRLPTQLADIYSTIYKEVQSAGDTSFKVADTTLQWLLCAQGRLSAADFVKAVSFDGTGQVLEVSPSTLLDICGNLVVLDTELDVFRFTHLSVREFLENRPDFSPKLTHATAAEICLNTLLTRDWLSSEITWEKATLYQYATLYWASHIERCGTEYRKNKIGETLAQLYARDKPVKPWFAKWLLQVESASQTLGWDDPLKDKIEQSLCNPETCLFTACTFGFSEVVELLNKDSPSAVKRVNVRQATGLHLASQYGHIDIVNILLNAGVEIDARDDSMETALVRACSAGHSEIVKLLLGQGADRNVQGAKFGTALQAASLHGHRRVVELLVDGADLNAESGQFGTALQAASLRGHHDVVRVLLATGADVNALGGEYTKTSELTTGKSRSDGVDRVVEFLLQQQSWLDARPPGSPVSPPFRHETIVQLLLDGGLDINIQVGGFGPALQAAARGGHLEVVRILLDAGADLSAEGGAYGTALQAAAVSGSDEIVRLLLESGAYVNTESGIYNTALQAASRRQHINIIRTLLENKADVNTPGGVYGSALQAAARTGSVKIVKVLLEQGADVNVQGGDYCTALQAAAAKGYQQIVQMLLDSGAEVDLRGGKYGTALQAAAGAGHTEVAQLLVECGAKYNCALQIAAVGGHDDVVRYLLEKGADPNENGGSFGTALQTATAAGQDKVVQILLDNNADTNSEGQHFGTALQIAAAAGNKELVRLLLEKGSDPTMLGGMFGTISSKLLEGENNERDDRTSDMCSALEAASAAGHQDVLQMLIDAIPKSGRQPDIRAFVGPLRVAAGNGHVNIVQLLLDNGADASPKQEQTPLQVAAQNGHENIVRLLLTRRADSNFASYYLPPLHAATKRSHEVIVQLLLERNSNVTLDTEYGTVVHIAAHGGFENLLRIFLNRGASANMIGESKITPLLLASVGGHDVVVKLLLDHGADPNTIVEGYSSKYWAEMQHGTALCAAADGGHVKVLQLLLDNGAIIDTSPHSSGTALQVACLKGNDDIVRILLEKGADTNVEGGITALQAAAYNASEDIVRLLLANRANVNDESGWYGTALQAAAARGDENIVQLLLSNGADVKREGGPPEEREDPYARMFGGQKTPVAAKLDPKGKRQKGMYGTSLQAAAFSGNVNVVRMLLDSGADIKVRDEHGQGPIHRAAYHGNTAVVDLLLTRGASVNEADDYGRTALRWVANYGYDKLFGFLASKGARVDIEDSTGQTAMHRAAFNDHISVVQKLIEKGLDVDAMDHERRTPLFSAAQNGKLNMVRFLLSAGSRIDRPDSGGSTGLHLAASAKHHTVVRLLLENGANVNAKNDKGYTPLHLAAKSTCYEVAYILLAHGAEIEALDSAGQTALHLAAAEEESAAVLALLIVKGANIDAKDRWGRGRTALDIATAAGEIKSQKVLRDKALISRHKIPKRGLHET